MAEKTSFYDRIVGEGITFDDVLLIPAYLHAIRRLQRETALVPASAAR